MRGLNEMPVDGATTTWMMISTALVLLMVPALAMFYGGLVRRKNVLGTMMHSFASLAVIGVIWTAVGYALTFGSSLGGIVGWDLEKVFLASADAGYVAGGEGKIPEAVFAAFQGMFAIITPAIIAGAFAERVRFGTYCLFIGAWSLLVYCPLAHMIWGGGALSGRAIDLAGGTVIHISAGIAGLVAALYLGARRGYGERTLQPNNLVMTMLGAGMLWVGWLGFNAGSQVSAGLGAAQAVLMTQVAGSAGAASWAAIQGLVGRRVTSVGLASGMLAGLVAITPGAGAVTPSGALALGGIASGVCAMAIWMKERLGYDDTLDVFGIHGVAGIVGAVGLAFFLREMPEHGVLTQLWFQVEGVLVASALSAVATLTILALLERTVGLRLDPHAEDHGMDRALHGEIGYDLRRDTLA